MTRLASVLFALVLAGTASADDVSPKAPDRTSVGLVLGSCNFSQGMGDQIMVGVHGDYQFSRWFNAGIFVDYTTIGYNFPGIPGDYATGNGNFYAVALELNFVAPGFLHGLYFGPSFGFSSFNSTPTDIQGSYNSIYMLYGARIEYDIPVVSGLSIGALASDLVVNSNSDLGFNTNQANVGVIFKFTLSETSD